MKYCLFIFFLLSVSSAIAKPFLEFSPNVHLNKNKPLQIYKSLDTKVVPIEDIDLTKIGFWDNNPLVYSDTKFQIYIGNQYCSESGPLISKDVLKKNLDYYSANLPILLGQLEELVKELLPGWIEEKEKRLYPVKLYISADGNNECFNATAYGNTIYLPALTSKAALDGMYELLTHEFGHTIQSLNGHDTNIFQETFADVISILLRDNIAGIFSYNAEQYYEESINEFPIASKDPEKYAKDNNLPLEYVKYLVWRTPYQIKCSSPEYDRDFRNKFPLYNIFTSGGEAYFTSCAINSFLFQVGQQTDYRMIIKQFAANYLRNPELFNNLNIPLIFDSIYSDLNWRSFDEESARLENIPDYNDELTVKILHYNNDGHTYWTSVLEGINYSDEDTYLKPIMASISKNEEKYPVASFSFSGKHFGHSLIKEDQTTCELYNYPCLCVSKGDIIQYKLYIYDGANELKKKVISIYSELPNGCYVLRSF